ncbi:MAG: phage tail protein [Methylococcales bacterium]
MAFITIAGEQLIAVKQGAGQALVVQNFVFANIPGLGIEPANRIEALPPAGQIVDTKAVTHQGYVNANQVVFSLSLDSTVGDYDFNWVGLKSAEGTLVACEHIPLTQKRKTAGTVPGNNLTRNFLMAFSGAAATTAIAVPAATWQIDFTTRLLQIDDRERLSNLDDYGTAAFYGTGFNVSLASATTYNIAAGVAYVSGIRCEKTALTALNVGTLPKGIWMDVSLQGNINGVAPVITFTASSTALANNTDGLGFKHYLFKIADIAASGAITDLRPGVTATQAEAEAGTSTTVKRWSPQLLWMAISKAIAVHKAEQNPHPVYASFAAGTRLLFAQAAAPTGWVQVTDATLHNRMLRVVNTATGGAVGGTNDPTVMNVVPSHTHTFSASGNTGLEGAHTHGFAGTTSASGAQSANHTHTVDPAVVATTSDSHSHTYTDAYYSGPSYSYASAVPKRATAGALGSDDNGSTAYKYYETLTTSVDAHNHTVNIPATTTSAANASHTHNHTPIGTVTATAGTSHSHSFSATGSVAANGGANWTPRYLDLILCAKA